MTRRLLLALALAYGMLAASSTEAQNSKDFSTVRFYPAVGVGNYLGVDGANVGSHLATTYGVMFDYSADTLKVDKPCEGVPNAVASCTNKETAFIHGTGLFHFMASLSLHDRTQLSLDIPIGWVDAQPFSTKVVTTATSSPAVTLEPHQGFAIADARLAAKTRILGAKDEPFKVSGTVFTTLPTAMIASHGNCSEAGTCSFTGERGVQIGGYAISELALPEFRVAANLGAQYRPSREWVTAKVGTEVLYGVAGQYNITPLFHAKAEVVGAVNVLGATDYPLEARGAFSYGEDLLFTLGGGAGIVRDVGAPSYRIFAGAQLTPIRRDDDQDGIEDRQDACPSDVEDRDGFMDQDGCPDPDNDGDGLPDVKDACDNEREDMDGFADDDGCPDPDNDGDGVPDGYDSCEGQKEDLDGDRDDDGCPDLDTDRDGVSDAVDRCPRQPEDTDGLGDDDGCPEVDFDGDSVKDTEDACPDQTEWWNDILDSDGCPEDDGDHDTVADQVDQCPDDAETLNGTKDGDGCPDGAMVMVLKGQMLLPTATAEFDKDVLRGSPALVDTVADYVKRNHKRGSLRVVIVAPIGDPEAEARAKHLAGLIAKRTGRSVSSAQYPGSPVHFEIELLPPGWTELPRPKPKLPPAASPSAKPDAATAPQPAAPAKPTATPAAAPVEP